MAEPSILITRVAFLPRDAKQKLRLRAAEKGTTLGEEVADLVRGYVENKYDGADGRPNLATVEDPGPLKTDSRVKFAIEESVWEQARLRTLMDETTMTSVTRRAAIALTLV